MLIIALIYNAVLVAADLAAWKLLGRRTNAARWGVALVFAAMSVVALAAIMAVDKFAFLHLLSYGLFGHIAFLLLVSAAPLARVSRPLAILSGLAAVGLWVIAFDAYLIEPTWLQVSYRELTSDKIVRPLRIVLLADIQTDRVGEHERRAFRLALEQKPDLLLFAGDYVQCGDAQTRQRLHAEINRVMKNAGIPDGIRICAVSGNVDRENWPAIFADINATVAQATTTLKLEDITITCLGLADSYRTDLIVENPQPDRYHIVLGHSPDFALGRVDADLLLAGHTHGGQVRLPWIGPLVALSRVPRAWAAGMSKLPTGAMLIVSRGIGMERAHAPRLRFWCRPEIVVIDLVPTRTAA